MVVGVLLYVGGLHGDHATCICFQGWSQQHCVHKDGVASWNSGHCWREWGGDVTHQASRAENLINIDSSDSYVSCHVLSKLFVLTISTDYISPLHWVLWNHNHDHIHSTEWGLSNWPVTGRRYWCDGEKVEDQVMYDLHVFLWKPLETSMFPGAKLGNQKKNNTMISQLPYMVLSSQQVVPRDTHCLTEFS